MFEKIKNYLKKQIKKLNNYRIDYYVYAFEQSCMFDNVEKDEPEQRKTKRTAFPEVRAKQSDKIRFVPRPRPLGKYVWNWAAFFGGPVWIIFRLGAAGLLFGIIDCLIFAVCIFMICLTTKVALISWLIRIIGMIFLSAAMIFHGYFGNYFYGTCVRDAMKEATWLLPDRFFGELLFESKTKGGYVSDDHETLHYQSLLRFQSYLIFNKKNVRRYLRREKNMPVFFVILLFIICCFGIFC